MKTDYDILIIGGGPAGLSCARSFKDTDLKIAVIEKSSEDALKNPSYDGREIALTHLSKESMESLGVWECVPDDEVSLIRHAKVLNGRSDYALHFDHSDSGEDNLGFMISNHMIRKATYDAVKKSKNVTLLTEQEVTAIVTNDESGVVTLADGQTLTASLVIAADSRFSSTRRMMGISTDMLDFGRTCVVCKMTIEKSHDDTALECFYFDQTLAILPLNNNEVSVVITIDSQKSTDLLALSKEAFAADIESRVDRKYGMMTLSTELYPYPLVATYAKTFFTNRFALVGDAAVGMHPVTAHGFNLGLRSAMELSNHINQARDNGVDFASQYVLKNYSDAHYRASRPIYLGTNALVKLYTKTSPIAKLARRNLLRLGNIVKPAKRLIMNQLTETSRLKTKNL